MITLLIFVIEHGVSLPHGLHELVRSERLISGVNLVHKSAGRASPRLLHTRLLLLLQVELVVALALVQLFKSIFKLAHTPQHLHCAGHVARVAKIFQAGAKHYRGCLIQSCRFLLRCHIFKEYDGLLWLNQTFSFGSAHEHDGHIVFQSEFR